MEFQHGAFFSFLVELHLFPIKKFHSAADRVIKKNIFFYLQANASWVEKAVSNVEESIYLLFQFFCRRDIAAQNLARIYLEAFFDKRFFSLLFQLRFYII